MRLDFGTPTPCQQPENLIHHLNVTVESFNLLDQTFLQSLRLGDGDISPADEFPGLAIFLSLRDAVKASRLPHFLRQPMKM